MLMCVYAGAHVKVILQNIPHLTKHIGSNLHKTNLPNIHCINVRPTNVKGIGVIERLIQLNH